MGTEKASTQTKNSANINTELQTLLIPISMTVGMYSWYVQISMSLSALQATGIPPLVSSNALFICRAALILALMVTKKMRVKEDEEPSSCFFFYLKEFLNVNNAVSLAVRIGHH